MTVVSVPVSATRLVELAPDHPVWADPVAQVTPAAFYKLSPPLQSVDCKAQVEVLTARLLASGAKRVTVRWPNAPALVAAKADPQARTRTIQELVMEMIDARPEQEMVEGLRTYASSVLARVGL